VELILFDIKLSYIKVKKYKKTMIMTIVIVVIITVKYLQNELLEMESFFLNKHGVNQLNSK